MKQFYTIIRGPLGIGKSTIAEALSKKLKAHYIPIDRVLEDSNIEEWEDGYVAIRSFIKANEIIAPKARKFLDKNIPVVFDGNFYFKKQIDDLIKRLNYPYHVFTLSAPLEVCIKRDAERGKTHGEDAAKAVYKKSTSFSYGNIIDTGNKSVKETINEIKKRLK